MEVMGVCSVCGRTAKLFTCMLCGSPVCSSCMRDGVCVRCARGRVYGGKVAGESN